MENGFWNSLASNANLYRFCKNACWGGGADWKVFSVLLGPFGTQKWKISTFPKPLTHHWLSSMSGRIFDAFSKNASIFFSIFLSDFIKLMPPTLIKNDFCRGYFCICFWKFICFLRCQFLNVFYFLQTDLDVNSEINHYFYAMFLKKVITYFNKNRTQKT